MDYRLRLGQQHFQIHRLRERCAPAAQSFRIINLQTCQQAMALLVFLQLQIRDGRQPLPALRSKKLNVGLSEFFLAQSASLIT